MHPIRMKRADSAIAWPSFTGQSVRAGVTPSGNVTVYFDEAGPVGTSDAAAALLKVADLISATNGRIFGIKPKPVNVILFALGGATDGTGGADHMSCSFTDGNNIEVCVALGQPARVAALFEAELSECCMNGSLCGYSTGEALSRWCAAAISGNALSDFATAPSWQSDGAANWVDQTDPTDQNADSTGCGMAFLSWVLAVHDLDVVAQAMVALGDGGTLAQLWQQLGGVPVSEAWTFFQGSVQALPNGEVTSDDPFGARYRMGGWSCVGPPA